MANVRRRLGVIVRAVRVGAVAVLEAARVTARVARAVLAVGRRALFVAGAAGGDLASHTENPGRDGDGGGGGVGEVDLKTKVFALCLIGAHNACGELPSGLLLGEREVEGEGEGCRVRRAIEFERLHEVADRRGGLLRDAVFVHANLPRP